MEHAPENLLLSEIEIERGYNMAGSDGARGGIEPSPIQLKLHHFLNDAFPVYLLVDPELCSRLGGCDSVPLKSPSPRWRAARSLPRPSSRGAAGSHTTCPTSRASTTADARAWWLLPCILPCLRDLALWCDAYPNHAVISGPSPSAPASRAMAVNDATSL